ncbi:MAG: GNAT family N-acetyltransferase [Pseudomonadota bacterium]
MNEPPPTSQSTRTHPFLTTPRLLFRVFEDTDYKALARISASPSVSRYVDDGEPLSAANTRLWIQRSRANVARFGYGTGAVLLRSSGELIGWAGFARGDDASDPDDEELIYGFDEPFWGQGYGTELLAGLIRYGFEQLQLGKLRATVYRANRASVRLLERQGFKCTQRDYESSGIDLYERWRDH